MLRCGEDKNANFRGCCGRRVITRFQEGRWHHSASTISRPCNGQRCDCDVSEDRIEHGRTSDMSQFSGLLSDSVPAAGAIARIHELKTPICNGNVAPERHGMLERLTSGHGGRRSDAHTSPIDKPRKTRLAGRLNLLTIVAASMEKKPSLPPWDLLSSEPSLTEMARDNRHRPIDRAGGPDRQMRDSAQV